MNWKSHINNNTSPSGHHKLKLKTSVNSQRKCIQVSLDWLWRQRTLREMVLASLKAQTISLTSVMQSAIKTRYPNFVINHNHSPVRITPPSCRSSSWTRPPQKNQSHPSSEVSRHHRTLAREARSQLIMVGSLVHKDQCKCHIRKQQQMTKKLDRKIRRILCWTNRTLFST